MQDVLKYQLWIFGITWILPFRRDFIFVFFFTIKLEFQCPFPSARSEAPDNPDFFPDYLSIPVSEEKYEQRIWILQVKIHKLKVKILLFYMPLGKIILWQILMYYYLLPQNSVKLIYFSGPKRSFVRRNSTNCKQRGTRRSADPIAACLAKARLFRSSELQGRVDNLCQIEK